MGDSNGRGEAAKSGGGVDFSAARTLSHSSTRNPLVVAQNRSLPSGLNLTRNGSSEPLNDSCFISPSPSSEKPACFSVPERKLAKLDQSLIGPKYRTLINSLASKSINPS